MALSDLTLARPGALLLWPACVLLLLALARLTRVRSRIALPLRLSILTLLVLALAAPRTAPQAAPSEPAPRQVILVDRSASVGDLARAVVLPALSAAGAVAPETRVVQFSEQPALVQAWEADWPAAEGAERASDLGAALDYAGRLLAGQGGSVVLVSDGEATAGDAVGAARRLAAAGITVDVWRAVPPEGADAAVLAVKAPDALWAGEPYSVTVTLYASQPTTATLQTTHDGERLPEQEVNLTAGTTEVALSAEATAEGLTAFEVQVAAPGDLRPENDFGGALGLVRSAPRVLIVAPDDVDVGTLRNALAARQVQVDRLLPEGLPASTQGLEPYQVVILADVPADDLDFAQLTAVEAFVRGEGQGLIVAGGRTSYTLGGYAGTALERLLPVRLVPPDRKEREPASLLLVIDRSGSMETKKLALAKEAAMRAVEILQPEDRVGVIAFNQAPAWLVPLGELGGGLALRGILDRISTLEASGGTSLVPPLRDAMTALAALPPGTKHVVLLSDGKGLPGAEAELELIVRGGIAAKITLTTVAIGSNADLALLRNMAEWGQGRYHYANTPESIPGLVLSESRAVRSEAVQRGQVQARIAVPHALVSTFAARDLPSFEAYLALQERPDGLAEVVLRAPLGDPLLAAWQYGLGRVVAWTSDVDGAWTPGWIEWPELGRFWTQIIRYALPDPRQDQVFAEATAVGSEITVTAWAVGNDGRGLDLAAARVVFAGADGEPRTVDLPQTGPGEYQVTFTAPAPGAYRAVVQLAKAGQRFEAPVGFVAGYSPEFRPAAGAGADLLGQIAAITGGQEVDGLGVPEVEASAAPPAAAPVDYGLWLVIAALALWPLEIAARRRWMPWR